MKIAISKKRKILIVSSSILFSLMILYSYFGIRFIIDDQSYLKLGLKHLIDSKSLYVSGGLNVTNNNSGDSFINAFNQVNLDIIGNVDIQNWNMETAIGVRLFDSSEKLFDFSLFSQEDRLYLDLKKYMEQMFVFPADLKQIRMELEEILKKGRDITLTNLKSGGYEEIYSNFINHRYYVTYFETFYEIRNQKLLYGDKNYKYPIKLMFYQDVNGLIKRIALFCDIERFDGSNVDQYELFFDIGYSDFDFIAPQPDSNSILLDEDGVKYIIEKMKEHFM